VSDAATGEGEQFLQPTQLTITLEAETAADLERVAHTQGTLASTLIRKWVMERLEQIAREQREQESQ
jgi:hypothetical protein